MDNKYFKEKLEEEKKRLEKELEPIANQNPRNSGNWETEPENLNIMPADINELADVFEENANKEAIEGQLEERLNEIKKALQKIKDEKYGICEIGGCKIEKERLEANPTATTCIKHAKNI